MRKHATVSVKEDRYLTPTEAAAMLGTNVTTLFRMRSGDAVGAPKLPFTRVGKKAVKYLLSDVERYVEIRTEQK